MKEVVIDKLGSSWKPSRLLCFTYLLGSESGAKRVNSYAYIKFPKREREKWLWVIGIKS